MTIRDQVIEFHRAVGQPVVDSPSVPAAERVRLRARLITEEYFETMEAIFGFSKRLREAIVATREAIQGSLDVNLPELVDGLADLDYVIEGTRLEFGVDGGPIAAEVHRANMAKAGGSKRPDGKIQKPPGWSPPDIAGELEKQRGKR